MARRDGGEAEADARGAHGEAEVAADGEGIDGTDRHPSCRGAGARHPSCPSSAGARTSVGLARPRRALGRTPGRPSWSPRGASVCRVPGASRRCGPSDAAASRPRASARAWKTRIRGTAPAPRTNVSRSRFVPTRKRSTVLASAVLGAGIRALPGATRRRPRRGADGEGRAEGRGGPCGAALGEPAPARSRMRSGVRAESRREGVSPRSQHRPRRRAVAQGDCAKPALGAAHRPLRKKALAEVRAREAPTDVSSPRDVRRGATQRGAGRADSGTPVRAPPRAPPRAPSTCVPAPRIAPPPGPANGAAGPVAPPPAGRALPGLPPRARCHRRRRVARATHTPRPAARAPAEGSSTGGHVVPRLATVSSARTIVAVWRQSPRSQRSRRSPDLPRRRT